MCIMWVVGMLIILYLKCKETNKWRVESLHLKIKTEQISVVFNIYMIKEGKDL